MKPQKCFIPRREIRRIFSRVQLILLSIYCLSEPIWDFKRKLLGIFGFSQDDDLMFYLTWNGDVLRYSLCILLQTFLLPNSICIHDSRVVLTQSTNIQNYSTMSAFSRPIGNAYQFFYIMKKLTLFWVLFTKEKPMSLVLIWQKNKKTNLKYICYWHKYIWVGFKKFG